MRGIEKYLGGFWNSMLDQILLATWPVLLSAIIASTAHMFKAFWSKSKKKKLYHQLSLTFALFVPSIILLIIITILAINETGVIFSFELFRSDIVGIIIVAISLFIYLFTSIFIGDYLNEVMKKKKWFCKQNKKTTHRISDFLVLLISIIILSFFIILNKPNNYILPQNNESSLIEVTIDNEELYLSPYTKFSMKQGTDQKENNGWSKIIENYDLELASGTKIELAKNTWILYKKKSLSYKGNIVYSIDKETPGKLLTNKTAILKNNTKCRLVDSGHFIWIFIITILYVSVYIFKICYYKYE